jgi:hypothetical protein
MERSAVFPVGTEGITVSYPEVDQESCSIYKIKFESTCVGMKYGPVFMFSILILFLLFICKSRCNQF